MAPKSERLRVPSLKKKKIHFSLFSLLFIFLFQRRPNLWWCLLVANIQLIVCQRGQYLTINSSKECIRWFDIVIFFHVLCLLWLFYISIYLYWPPRYICIRAYLEHNGFIGEFLLINFIEANDVYTLWASFFFFFFFNPTREG